MATAVKGKKGFIKLPKNQVRTNRKTLFFTDKELRELNVIAESKGMTLIDYIRYKVLEDIS